MRKILCLLLMVLPGMLLFSQDMKLKRRLLFQGEMIDYKWSKDSRTLAILYTDQNEAFKISLINTANARIKKTLSLPYRVTAFDWMEDDQSFLMTRPHEDYSFTLLEYRIRPRQILDIDARVEHVFSGISSINIAPHTNLWAITYFAEGLVDTAVYEHRGTNLTMIFSTEVYGGVYSLFWNGGLLYCQSFVDLEMGLTESERLAYFKKQGWGKEAEYYNSEYYMGDIARLYGLDIYKKTAYTAHDIAMKERDFSYNKKFYVLIRPDTNNSGNFFVSLYD